MHLRLASKPLQSELNAGQRLERRLHPELNAADAGGWQPPSARNGAVTGPPAGVAPVLVDEWSGSAHGSGSGRRRSASPPRDRGGDRYRERADDRYRR